MITYFDRVLYLYPNIQKIVYWHTNSETNKPWADPYDGLVWNNNQIEKPLKTTLDSLDSNMVKEELANREEIARKALRDANLQNDLGLKALYQLQLKITPTLVWSQFLDNLEVLQVTND